MNLYRSSAQGHAGAGWPTGTHDGAIGTHRRNSCDAKDDPEDAALLASVPSSFSALI